MNGVAQQRYVDLLLRRFPYTEKYPLAIPEGCFSRFLCSKNNRRSRCAICMCTIYSHILSLVRHPNILETPESCFGNNVIRRMCINPPSLELHHWMDSFTVSHDHGMAVQSKPLFVQRVLKFHLARSPYAPISFSYRQQHPLHRVQEARYAAKGIDKARPLSAEEGFLGCFWGRGCMHFGSHETTKYSLA